MQIQKLKPLFIATVGLLAVVGTVLAVASYFYGLLFILAAVVLLFLYRLKTVDRETYNRQMRQFLMNLAIPLLGIAIAIIIGGVIMALTGYDPITAYAALFYGGFVRNWHVSILNSVPLIFTGLSVAFAFKAGLFNIGAEGQYYVGAMVAAYLGITMNLPPFFSIMIIFFVSGLVAAAYNFIPALLKVKTGAHDDDVRPYCPVQLLYLHPCHGRQSGYLQASLRDRPYSRIELASHVQFLFA